MKALICLVMTFLLAFSTLTPAFAATKTVCTCKQYTYKHYTCKHHKKHKKTKKYQRYYYYQSESCYTQCCRFRCPGSSVCRTSCNRYCDSHVYKCHTEFAYRQGRNSARVDVCY